MRILGSLSSKISLATGCAIILTTLIISTTVYLTAKESLLTHTVTTLQSNANLVASDIENSLEKLVDDLAVLSNTPPIQGLIRSHENAGVDTFENSTTQQWNDRLSRIFAAMLKTNPAYTQIRYIGQANDGMELVRVNRTREEVFRTHESALQKKGSTEYFKQVSQLAQGSIIFSSINYNQENNKIEVPLIPTLRVMMPIYTDKQNFFGALVINVNMESYLRNVLLLINEKYTIYLYDDYGDLFVYDPNNKTLKFFSKNKTNSKNHNPSLYESIEKIKANPNSIVVTKSIYSSHNKKNKVFEMVLEANKADLFKADNQLINNLLIIIVIVSIIAVFFIYIFSKYLLRNLRQMAEVIEQSTGGVRKELVLPTNLHDEVGILARAFERKTRLLNELALFDSLTGLPNRKNFMEHFGESILRAKRSAKHLAIFFIDLNNFKKVNDKYGHDYGDELLIHFSRNLQNVTREAEYCARLGGDEFVVMLENIEDTTILDQIIERFRSKLNTTCTVKGLTLHISTSIGYAIYPEDGNSIEELLKKADASMYADKQRIQDEL